MNVTTLGKGMMDTAYPLHDILCLSMDDSGPRESVNGSVLEAAEDLLTCRPGAGQRLLAGTSAKL